MRVAHSGTSNLKNLPNLPKIDPCSGPWKSVTFVVRNWIFIVPTLHARSYLSCKNQRLDLITVATLTCQTQVEYRWNTCPAGQFVFILGVPCYTYNFKCLVGIRLKLHVCTPMQFSYHACNYMVGTYAGRLQRDVKFEKSSKFAKNWPVQRALKKGNIWSPGWIFIVLTLHAGSYLSCKNQRPDLLTLVTLTCQTEVEYRGNTSPAGQFVLISGVPCYTYNFKCPISIRFKLHVSISM